jgi:hypothetical protein
MECVYCATGPLRPSRLTLLFTYGGRGYPLADPCALLCDHCGEASISQRRQRAAAALTIALTMGDHTPHRPSSAGSVALPHGERHADSAVSGAPQ